MLRPPDLRIEPCTPGDLPAVQELLGASPEAALWSNAALAGALTQHASYFFLARSGRELAGFVLARRVLQEAEILNLAVTLRFRRHGVARALVLQLLAAFRRDELTHIYLEVRASNFPAIALYQSLGFRQVAERPSYYQDPVESAIVMNLQLARDRGTS